MTRQWVIFITLTVRSVFLFVPPTCFVISQGCVLISVQLICNAFIKKHLRITLCGWFFDCLLNLIIIKWDKLLNGLDCEWCFPSALALLPALLAVFKCVVNRQMVKTPSGKQHVLLNYEEKWGVCVCVWGGLCLQMVSCFSRQLSLWHVEFFKGQFYALFTL